MMAYEAFTANKVHRTDFRKLSDGTDTFQQPHESTENACPMGRYPSRALKPVHRFESTVHSTQTKSTRKTPIKNARNVEQDVHEGGDRYFDEPNKINEYWQESQLLAETQKKLLDLQRRLDEALLRNSIGNQDKETPSSSLTTPMETVREYGVVDVPVRVSDVSNLKRQGDSITPSREPVTKLSKRNRLKRRAGAARFIDTKVCNPTPSAKNSDARAHSRTHTKPSQTRSDNRTFTEMYTDQPVVSDLRDELFQSRIREERMMTMLMLQSEEKKMQSEERKMQWMLQGFKRL